MLHWNMLGSLGDIDFVQIGENSDAATRLCVVVSAWGRGIIREAGNSRRVRVWKAPYET